MRGIGYWVLAVIFGVCLVGESAIASADLSVSKVRDLYWDPYEAMVFNDSTLWIGSNRDESAASKYFLEAYSEDGSRLLGRVQLRHTLEFLYPYGPDQVLVVGKHATEGEWQTFFTVARLEQGRVIANTVPIPEEVMVEQIGGVPGRLFFNTGVNKLVEYRGHGLEYLAPVISNAGQMMLLGDSLFVLERNSIYLGDENIVKVDLSSQSADRTFKDRLRNGITGFVPLRNGALIAAAETLANQILLIDTTTNTLVKTLSTSGNPRALAELGRCLVSFGWVDHALRFFDTTDSGFKQIGQWDLSPILKDRYTDLRDLVVTLRPATFSSGPLSTTMIKTPPRCRFGSPPSRCGTPAGRELSFSERVSAIPISDRRLRHELLV